MLTIKDHKQQELFDPWAFLSPKRRRILDEGWPGLFRAQILEELPVAQTSPSFCSDLGRPSKELYALLGALLLQQAVALCAQHHPGVRLGQVHVRQDALIRASAGD
jgi:hypothetical protein